MSSENISPQQILFEQEAKIIIGQEIYKDPKRLFEWAEAVTRKAMRILDSLSGNNTALELGEILGNVDDSEKVFQNIVEYGKSIGIHSEVQTQSLRYQSIVVVGTHLDRIGLGFSKKV